MSDKPKRYRAFISYSQKDKRYAQRLHRALENYRLPRGVEAAGIDVKTRKLGRFFRDDEEMGAATDLGDALQGAIADANTLIVVCSPHAAQSRWVNEEIIHFKRTGRADRIFAVIVGGVPHAPAERAERECFPPALRFELGADGALTDQIAEPLGLDLRKEPFNRLIARLAAGLVNTPFDALWKREQRRARARTTTLSLGLILAALIVGGALTQNMWTPRLDAYLRYTRHAHDAAALRDAPPGATFQDCRQGSGDCPVMVVIPEGRFVMGSAPDDPEIGAESPQRELSIAHFAVSRNEITFADWLACVAAGGCDGYRPDRHGWTGDDRPAINVSWRDAQNYVAWLSRMTGQHYRLLTEAEWEYAARAQTSLDAPRTRFSWGDEDPVCRTDAPNGAAFAPPEPIAINFDAPEDVIDGCAQNETWPAASFPANRFGLHDMHGNVSEWVEDCFTLYDATNLDAAAVETNRGVGASECSARVHRGGSLSYYPPMLRSAYRGMAASTLRVEDIGFRVARTL